MSTATRRVEEFRWRNLTVDPVWQPWKPRWVDGKDEIMFPEDPDFEYQTRHAAPDASVYADPPIPDVPVRVPLRRGEVRVTDPKTGGQKGDKPEHMGDLDPEALLVLATVAGIGASKYSPHNFLRGYAWSLSFNAMMRHAFAFWAGEDLDPETGQPHVAHAAWHGLALTSFLVRQIGTDDRPPKKGV